MRPLCILIAAGAAMAGCTAQQSSQVLPVSNPPTARPNIVFIMSDDHAYQAISAYGSDVSRLAPTPNIDRIAKNGAIFLNSYVTNSLCGPSRGTMLTGQFSHMHGFTKNGQHFDNNR